jgi:hypothetical protein
MVTLRRILPDFFSYISNCANDLMVPFRGDEKSPNISKIFDWISPSLRWFVTVNLFLTAMLSILMAGALPFFTWVGASVLFYKFMYIESDETRKGYMQLIRSACIVALCMFPHIVLGVSSQWLYQVALIALLSGKSIIPQKNATAKAEKHDPFLANALLISAGLVIYLSTRDFLRIFIISLAVATPLDYLATNFMTYVLLLFPVFALAIVSGWGIKRLFNQENRSFGQSVRYFFAGMMIIILPLSGFSAMFIPAPTTFIYSVNLYVQYSSQYLFRQGIRMVICLMQTLFEELTFRALLYNALKSAGLSEDKDPDDAKQGKSIWKQFGTMLLMGTSFAMAHMGNPVETGRQWLSGLEKFISYFFNVGIGFIAGQVLTGGIELAWGMHFAHNFKIFLSRYDSEVGTGAIRPNQVFTNTSETLGNIDAVCSGLLQVGAVYAMSKLLNATSSEHQEESKAEVCAI